MLAPGAALLFNTGDQKRPPRRRRGTIVLLLCRAIAGAPRSRGRRSSLVPCGSRLGLAQFGRCRQGQGDRRSPIAGALPPVGPLGDGRPAVVGVASSCQSTRLKAPQLGVQADNQAGMPGSAPEHLEARPVVTQLCLDLSLAGSPGRQQSQLAHLRDLVRRVNGERLGADRSTRSRNSRLRSSYALIDGSSETAATSCAMRVPNSSSSSSAGVAVFSRTSWSSPAATTWSGWPSPRSSRPTSIG